MSIKPNPAVFYSAPDYSTGGERLMGKNSANEGFLKAYVHHAGVENFHCYSQTEKGFTDFCNRVNVFAAPRKPQCEWISTHTLHALKKTGGLYIPSCQIDFLAWQRRRIGQRAYSISGITHTMASEGPMEILRNVVFGPTQPWDALICTSQAVKSSVEYVIAMWCEYFSQRFHAPKFWPPLKLPVIPLGVDTAQYQPTEKNSEVRVAWRKKLGIKDNDIAFLFIGRLSAHAKAHPVAMYQALEKAARKTKKKLHLIQAGWFSNDGIERSFKEGARDLCSSVTHHFLDGRKSDVRRDIWHVADIFTSLSDNIQETFGLTPIEAMAAGLPSVVTDWDGYRDTVRDGIDGFTIPTLSPAPGMSNDLAFRFETGVDNYDHYLANACQITSVDIAACTRAYLELIETPELRKKMGNAAMQRAHDIFDWRHIIAAYQELWFELDELRRSQTELVPSKPSLPANPSYADPFMVFGSYPSAYLNMDHNVCLLPGYSSEDFKTLRGMFMNQFGYLAPVDLMTQTLKILQEKGPAPMGELVKVAPQEHRVLLARSLIWCAKTGMISIGEHNAEQSEKPTRKGKPKAA